MRGGVRLHPSPVRRWQEGYDVMRVAVPLAVERCRRPMISRRQANDAAEIDDEGMADGFTTETTRTHLHMGT